ncbi:MAG: MltA domain-containing protein [Planctomycetota bacterium]|jgi:membrane-bound lytic murein transglycosylase A|nr:MltA domain-containing protein [Planctomycetota bacterium]MDP6940815.1 MltA domain-containing protein [Planctomycetota bacterium]
MRFLRPTLCTLAILGACQTPAPSTPVTLDDFSLELAPGESGLARVPLTETPDFSAGWFQRDRLQDSIRQSLSFLASPSSKDFFPFGPVTHPQMVASLERFSELLESSENSEDFGKSISNEFDVWMARGRENSGEVLFTGYCRPIFKGSRKATSQFRFPLYRLPDDLIKGKDGSIQGRRTKSGKLVPYFSRSELNNNNHLKGLEFVWLDDAYDAYIAHVQGSALIQLPDGEFIEAGYAGKNGLEYQSVGQALIAEGSLKKSQLSLSGLRKYFRDNPSEVDRALSINPSFVFFQPSEGGPLGCLGRKVTPMRSLATDKDVFPRASLVFCEVRLPDFDSNGELIQRPQRFFALDQDRGGAIRSAGRCDVFMGTGPEAMKRSGHTMAIGRMYYLFLRS